MGKKLIKVDNGWVLMVDNIMYATDKNAPYARLSIKNCEEIENGYDLDELAKNIKTEDGFEHKQSFISGFQKALEILGDKKYSGRNMLKAFTTGVFTDETSDYDFEFTELMQDLQQTEWDVEILTHAKENGLYTKEDGFEQEPKLDANGCIILKLK